MDMNVTKICPGCRRPLVANAPDGLCPQCLMKAGLGTGVDVGLDSKGESGQIPFVAPSLEEVSRLFPQLEMLGFIGQGGMGAVYKARQKALDRVVALKILPPGIGKDMAFAERFTREAKALARLNHPGIVTLYEFGQADGLFFFLMEFVDGVSLRHLLEVERISAREALVIVPQICDALQYAHDQGIVHRDIKPENILLDRQGRVKVADFGLAKLAEDAGRLPLTSSLSPSEGEGDPTLTEVGKVMGTPQYMAPEQREHPMEVDHRADIYSLGVVFYQMLTGELPGKPIEPPSRRVQVDVRLDEIVLRALEKEPARRYQQVSQMLTAVQTIAQMPETAPDRTGPGAVPPDLSVTTLPPLEGAGPTRTARWPWAVAIAAVVLLITDWLLLRYSGKAVPPASPEELTLRQGTFEEVLWNPGFEAGLQSWEWSGASWKMSATTDHVHSGQQAAIASNRTESWQGLGQSLLGRVKPGRTYYCSAWVRIENAPQAPVTLSVSKVDDSKNGALRHRFVGSRTVVENEWKEIHGTYVLDDTTGVIKSLFFSIGGPPPGVNLLVDDVSVKAMPDAIPSRPVGGADR